jgi:hypothetical protein
MSIEGGGKKKKKKKTKKWVHFLSTILSVIFTTVLQIQKASHNKWHNI